MERFESAKAIYQGRGIDVEQAGSARAKAAVQAVEGLEALRPSVEAGFHSLLDTYVLHTHSVYANLACCARDGREIAAKVLSGADYGWGMVPYVDPGARLTFAIRDELRRVEAETGRRPAVILMQNHGILVHHDDPGQALAIHADANERIARAFGLTGDSFPAVRLREAAPGLYEADVPYLTAALAGGKFTEARLLEQPLYPDQMVFLTGTFSMDREDVPEGQCAASSRTGQVRMRMDRQRAQVLAETLTAVVFILQTLEAAGRPVSTMGEAARQFIAGWESEQYRKSLAGKQ